MTRKTHTNVGHFGRSAFSRKQESKDSDIETDVPVQMKLSIR